MVDHALRAESRQEAQFAVHELHKLGVLSRLLPLRWPAGKPPAGQLMEVARERRYAVLERHASQLGCSFLLTGHHAGKHRHYSQLMDASPVCKRFVLGCANAQSVVLGGTECLHLQGINWSTSSSECPGAVD